MNSESASWKGISVLRFAHGLSVNRVIPLAGFLCAAMVAIACCGSSVAFAQLSYPTRVVRILVGFPPGSGPDGSLRVLANKLSENWGKPVIVENVTGAAGNLACDRTAKAAPDGYTLVLCTNGALAISPGLYASMPFDPLKDLMPIVIVSSADNILVVPPSLPARTVAELITLAKSKPGQIIYGHGGVGSTQHLAAALFKSMANIDIQPVAYRGAIAVIPDLLAGRLQMFFGNIANVLPLANSGQLRALASTGKKRSGTSPSIPTMDELGFPGFDVIPWYGLMAPAGTPEFVIDKIYSETNKILALPEIREQFRSFGFDVVGGTQKEFFDAIRRETEFWTPFLRNAGIKATD